MLTGLTEVNLGHPVWVNADWTDWAQFGSTYVG